MAKKVKIELTPEQKMAEERARLLSPEKIQEIVAFMGKPTYRFAVGDEVRYGAMKSSVVEEIIEDCKAYLLKCVAVHNNYGKPFEEECYRLVKWVNVRPLTIGDTNFAADLTIVEEASELIHRITKQDAPLPQFTSCCPAWVKFAETYYPELLPHISTAKSPIGNVMTSY